MDKPKEEKTESATAAAREATHPRIKVWTRLLTKAEKDPFSVLRDKRCLRPHFVEKFFELCDAKVLAAPLEAKDFVEAAAQLAAKTEVRHHAVRVTDLLIHACINVGGFEQAAEFLEEFRELACGCCRPCTSLWLRRKGDYLLETRDPEASKEALAEALAVLGDDLDDETRGHALFLRGIAHYGPEDVERALDDMGEALRLWSLSKPQPHFKEAIALIACFLEHTDDLDHFEAALDHLTRFRERLYDLRYWTEVRDRLRWVTGQIEAVLDRPRVARPLLERARKNALEHSPHHHVLAIGLDEVLLICRGSRPELYSHSVRRIMTWCSEKLELEEELCRGLDEAMEKFTEEPFNADFIFSELRRSYVVPVPCLVRWL